MAQDDDSFGLPDLNYKPLEPKPETPPPSPPKVDQPAGQAGKKVEKKPTPPKQTGRIQSAGTPNRVVPRPGESDGEKPNTSVIVGILVPILILVGGYFGYLYLYKKPKEKAAAVAAYAKEKEEKERKAKEEAARLAKQKEEDEARAREAEANAKPAIGTIETLSARTGRFYVIAASSIDDDLIMDEAKRMSAKGVSSKIIPPYGKWKYFRLTISDHDTFALAQTKADELKAELGSGLWVMRY